MRWSLRVRWMDQFCAWCQRVPGAGWVDICTRNIRHTYGQQRLPDFVETDNFVIVSNHRSYFDMFVITMELFRNGLRRRALFPVRSGFFYDNPVGWLVNGAMSFWSMYPPVFRDRKRTSLNKLGVSELERALSSTHACLGIHPEGTRGTTPDPYKLLPAKSGVGHIVHRTHKMVIPAFINGLGNNLPKQVRGNFNKRGEDVVVVFGEPIDFGTLLDEPAGTKTYRRIAQRCMDVVAELGEEEKQLRAALPSRESRGLKPTKPSR